MNHRPTYTLTLEPEPSRPDGPSIEQRLRLLLKAALRSYGFRCTGVVQDSPGKLPPAPPALDPTKTEPPFA